MVWVHHIESITTGLIENWVCMQWRHLVGLGWQGRHFPSDFKSGMLGLCLVVFVYPLLYFIRAKTLLFIIF